ncbi:MAG: 30S ribosomal protein S4 [Anaerolineae bacterium]|jgi:small subunit ribosomal protein S4|nr:30S ribosomal protein S4 [Anaerolineae bacterium]
MASYHGPKAKVMRRFGEALIPRAKYQKILEKRAYPPGEHGKEKQFKSGRRSDYGSQLDAKQKLSFIFNIRETQLRRYFRRATRMAGRTGGNLLALLETRLDNIVYRAGFAATIWAARQMVGHGHITVNGKVVNLPSYAVLPNDVIGVVEKMRRNVHVTEAMESGGSAVSYIQLDRNAFSASLLRVPDQEEIPVQNVDIQLVVEFYNRLT